MIFRKNGSKYFAIGRTGDVIAYIEPHYMGPHGHQRGWVHYAYCPAKKCLMWAGVLAKVIYPDVVGTKRWTEAPLVFGSVKEFKAYYSDRVS